MDLGESHGLKGNGGGPVKVIALLIYFRQNSDIHFDCKHFYCHFE